MVLLRLLLSHGNEIKMIKNEFCLAYMTVKNKKEGQYISKIAIDKNLAACGNLFPEIQSIYKWEKKINIEKESVLILKTTNKKYKDLESLILKIHSYETPCIIKLSLDDGNKNFLNWINETVNTKN